MTPTAIPAFAPVERPPEELEEDDGRGVDAEVDDADEDDDEVVVEVELELAAVDDEEEAVELVPPLVDTMLPLPSMTMPRFSVQHAGSLSQQ